MDRTDGSNRIHLRVLSALLPLLAGTLVVATTDSARAAWDGTQNIRAGDSVGAEFAGPAGTEVHRYTFYVPDKTVLNADLKVLGKTSLAMNLRLLDSAGNAVNLGANLVGTSLKKFTVATRGYYTIEVTSKTGVGRYTMKTTAAYPKPIKIVAATCTLPVAPATTSDTNIDVGGAPQGTIVRVASVKANKLNAAAKLGFRKITGPNGTIDLGKPADLTDLVPLAGPVTLPQNGTYNLVVGNDGGGDKADLGVTLLYPKGGALYAFPVVESTAGIADQNRTKWLASGHNDLASDAFSDWNNSVPAVVPTSCAKCHSTAGYRDFIGADGPGHLNDAPPSAGQGQVATISPPVGTGVTCDACHNDATLKLDTVRFPSGKKATGLGKEARCMICHQGRESSVSVEAAITKMTVAAKVTNVESTTTPGTGPGILGLNTAIAAGTTFLDTDADFTAAGVTGDGTCYLEFVTGTFNLNGTTGVAVTKNAYRTQITAVPSANTLTLATALVAETPAAGKSFQYRITRRLSDDTVTGSGFASLGFKNIHYFAAAATLYGREAAGMVEYADPAKVDPAKYAVDADTGLLPRKSYDSKFAHVASEDTCITCHDPHSLRVRVLDCAKCHVGKDGSPVATKSQDLMTADEYEAAIDKLREVRMDGTLADFDHNGQLDGIYFEIAGMRDTLLAAIQDYAKNGAPGVAIGYRASAHPYWYTDTNGNGVVDDSEAISTNAFTKWTPRLLRAAFNYQQSVKDTGAFAHNAKYVIEILYDAIADLDSVRPIKNIPSLQARLPNGLADLVRNDSGHFDTSAEAYRHWDEQTIPTPPATVDHMVDPSCTKCHAQDGFLFRITYNVDMPIPAIASSGMTCESCHETDATFTKAASPARRYVSQVVFPVPTTATSAQIAAVTIANGAKGTAAQDDSYLCMTCHQARESTLTIDTAYPTPTSTFTLSFKNSHYLGAGASLYGTKAAVAYQYTGKTYVQRWDHKLGYTTAYPTAADPSARCAYCHLEDGDHSFEARFTTGNTCDACHATPAGNDITKIKPGIGVSYNFVNDATKTPKEQFAIFQDRLYAAVQAYCNAAVATGGLQATKVVYNGAAYPYWLQDTNGNGVWDTGETTGAKFDSKAVRASFNYNFSVKEPGMWAHNFKYALQILYDSIQDMNGDLSNLTRP